MSCCGGAWRNYTDSSKGGVSGAKLHIDQRLQAADLGTKISYVSLVQTKEVQPYPNSYYCTGDRHYGVRVVLKGAPGARDKHVLLQLSCQENSNTTHIDDVTNDAKQREKYEVKPGHGKSINDRDVNVLKLRDAVTSRADLTINCLSIAKIMYNAATGEEEAVASSPQTDEGVQLSDVDVTTLVDQLNTKTSADADSLVENRFSMTDI